MNRREYLAGAGLAVTASLGGCALVSDGSDDTDSMAELTGYTVSDVAANPRNDSGALEPFGLYIASEDAAETRFGSLADEEGEDAAAAYAFVEDTAFEEGERLLYLRGFGKQACYELILAGEPTVTDDGIPRVETAANRTEPPEQPCGDAIIGIDLLLRLSFDPSAGAPDVVEATVPDMDGSEVELVLETDGESGT